MSPEWVGLQMVVKINRQHPFYAVCYGEILSLVGGYEAKRASTCCSLLWPNWISRRTWLSNNIVTCGKRSGAGFWPLPCKTSTPKHRSPTTARTVTWRRCRPVPRNSWRASPRAKKGEYCYNFYLYLSWECGQP